MPNPTARGDALYCRSGDFRLILAIACLAFGSWGGWAATEVSPEEKAAFQALGWEKMGYLIPMRDGAHLYTEVLRPLGANGPLPILLKRTPYNASMGETNFAKALTNSLKELVADGYLLAYQDIRGKFRSEGQFVMCRPPRRAGVELVD